MTSRDRRVILYIATSLDGYIARESGDIEWLTAFDDSGQDYGYGNLLQRVDTLIMGRKTYEQVLSFPEWPYADFECIVMSRRVDGASSRATLTADPPAAIIDRLRRSDEADAGDIWLVGGAEAVASFQKEGLIDEYIISVIPIILGSGIRLFPQGLAEERLKLIDSTAYASGLVKSTYTK